MLIANDTDYGLSAGIWTRNQNYAYRVGRIIQAGQVWVHNYRSYLVHAAFGGYKMSGIGRQTHSLALSRHRESKMSWSATVIKL